MKKALGKMFTSCKGALDITSIIVDVVLVVALIPIIVSFIGNAENLTTTESTLLGLTTTFIVLGLIFAVGKQTGLIKGKR